MRPQGQALHRERSDANGSLCLLHQEDGSQISDHGEADMTGTLKLIVPLTPPSVQHYMKQRVATINGRQMVMYYPSREAKDWWKAVSASCGGKVFEAKSYEIAYVVYQGHNERGDVDNYAKTILDGLVKSQVIDTDHKVIAMHAYKTRDRDNPRTEIFIRALGQLSLLEPPMPAVDDW